MIRKLSVGAPAFREPRGRDEEWARLIHHRAYREIVTAQFGRWDEQEQDRFFRDVWDRTDHRILVVNGQDVGYSAMPVRGDHLFIEEIVIDPYFQGRGIGSAVVRQAQAQAAAQGLPVRLQVLHENRARALYRRLGFEVADETDTHVWMEWRPD